MKSHERSADAFLKVAHQFKLGGLDTEGFHPETKDLSTLAQKNMPEAIRALQRVDAQALGIFAHLHAEKLPALAAAIADTFHSGGRVFLCGCGATGRLSLALEWLCRDGLLPKKYAHKVVAFMAGGDAALIRSIEAFEDHPEFGARQLQELKFGKNDLLIASTEGGETPWVIGAAEKAARLSKRAPWFLYCNPDAPLRAAAERSARVLDNANIKKMNLSVGPMAIAGSTRMQASTVLMAAIGFALRHYCDPHAAMIAAQHWAQKEINLMGKRGRDFPEKTAQDEADAYLRGEYTLYSSADYALSVLTDTTERSPTFSLPIFENARREGAAPICLCYLHMPKTATPAQAWKTLLKRAPRCLEWDFCEAYSGKKELMGYDISDKVKRLRKKRVGKHKQHLFEIDNTKEALRVCFFGKTFLVQDPGDDVLERNLLLKMLLNTHSTALMARMGRCHGNVMTHVKPSNLKLIDRAIRYVQQLRALKNEKPLPYETICRALFDARENLKPDEPIVLKTLARLSGGR